MAIWGIHEARKGNTEIHGLKDVEISEYAQKSEKNLVKALVELRENMEKAWLPKGEEIVQEVLRLHALTA